MQTIGQFEEV